MKTDDPNPDRNPKIHSCDGYCVIEFRGKASQIMPVYVDDLGTAQQLITAGPWHLHPAKPGKEKFLRRSIRVPGQNNPTTEYAHHFLLRVWGVAEEERKERKPRDANYFNLRSENFASPKPRDDEQMERFMALIGEIYNEMREKALRALHDGPKADDAISATVEHVTDWLLAGKGNFPCDTKFKSWVFSILEARILERQKQRGALGDIVLGKDERKFRGFPMNGASSVHHSNGIDTRDEDISDSDWAAFGNLSSIPLNQRQRQEWNKTAATLLGEEE